MKVAIMQPYFLPYIGYFQLVSAVDVLVVYDNVKYTKKGWINRNRFLLNGRAETFTVPLRNEGDHLDIAQRHVAPEFNRGKLLARIRNAYRGAPHFEPTYRLVEGVVTSSCENLFDYLLDGLTKTCEHLGLRTRIIVSSSVDADHAMKSQDRVIDIARAVGATDYVNPIGGLELYSRQAFSDAGLQLRFLQSRHVEYPQFDLEFVPWLSIMDVLMFNGAQFTRDALLPKYELI